MNMYASYSVLQMRPSRDRQEIVTVGLVVLHEGKWDVRVLPAPTKLIALNPFFPPAGLVNIQQAVAAVLAGASDFEAARARLAKHGNDPGLQSYVGQFFVPDRVRYESKITELMRRLVIPLLREPTEKRQVSKVRKHLKKKFMDLGILGAAPEDINKHKIVEKFPIAEDRGLYADFAVANGSMNITETVDFDVKYLSRKVVEAQAKTLVLSAAAREFGPDTKRYVVVSGSNFKQAMPSITLLEDYAEVFEITSDHDMARYYDLIGHAVAHH